MIPNLPQGYLHPDEEAALYRLGGTNNLILEIGAFWGRSTHLLAQQGSTVVSVDPHDGRTGDTCVSYNGFLDGLKAAPERRISCYRGTSLEAFRDFPGTLLYGVIFVDGDHSYAAVRDDIDRWVPRLLPGGKIAFHDYGEPKWPGVTRAITEAVEAGRLRVLEVHHRLAICEVPVELP